MAGARHRVLLVREWDEQTPGSGCCGGLSEETVRSLVADREPGRYVDHHAERTRCGAVYQALRARFCEDELELIVVDPRNTAWLLPALWRDARRRGLSRTAAARQVNAGTTPCALVCDGLVLSVDAGPAEAVDLVEGDLATRP